MNEGEKKEETTRSHAEDRRTESEEILLQKRGTDTRRTMTGTEGEEGGARSRVQRGATARRQEEVWMLRRTIVCFTWSIGERSSSNGLRSGGWRH